MRNTDLAELRAQLRAATAPERAQGSLLARLRSLTGSPEAGRTAILHASQSERPRARRLPSAYDLEAPPPPADERADARRRAFGQREARARSISGAASAVLPSPDPPLLLLPTAAIEAEELGAALRRLRPSLARPEPAPETPFLDEDLSDDFDAESIYRAAGMLGERAPAPAVKSAAQEVLTRLAEALEQEMAALGARRERAA